MSLSRRRRTFFLATLVVVNLIVIEGAARLHYNLSRGPEPVVPPEIGQHDPLLGWSLKPGVVAISGRTGTAVEYRINSHGLRDDEVAHEKPEGVIRIVLLGNSHTFGFGVPIEKHFSRLLEGYLDGVEVINLGVAGYGIDQELLALRQHGFAYDPDLVVAYVAHYGDHRHMHTRRFGREKPRFVLKQGKLVLENSPVSAPRLWTSASGLAAPHQWLRRQSAAYRILIGRLDHLISKDENGPSPNLTRQQDEYNMLNPAFVSRLHELGEAIIAKMNDEVTARGARFALVTRMPELHDACIQRGIPTLDVSTALNNPAFRLPDGLGHMNESGNGVLAWEIATFIQRARLLEP